MVDSYFVPEAVANAVRVGLEQEDWQYDDVAAVAGNSGSHVG